MPPARLQAQGESDEEDSLQEGSQGLDEAECSGGESVRGAATMCRRLAGTGQ